MTVGRHDDGKPIANVDQYRVATELFGFTLPDNNVMEQLWGVENAPAGTYDAQAVADGRWLIFKPLPKGEHTLYLHGVIPEGTSAPFGAFETDVTYHFTVE
ncbi:MAG: hypothetical protein AB7P03_17165 [Kofleriaceae bacterium]